MHSLTGGQNQNEHMLRPQQLTQYQRRIKLRIPTSDGQNPHIATGQKRN